MKKIENVCPRTRIKLTFKKKEEKIVTTISTSPRLSNAVGYSGYYSSTQCKLPEYIHSTAAAPPAIVTKMLSTTRTPPNEYLCLGAAY